MAATTRSCGVCRLARTLLTCFSFWNAAQGFSSIAVDAAHYYDTSEVVINTLVTASNTAQIIVVRSCAACAAPVAPSAPLTGALLCSAHRHWCGR